MPVHSITVQLSEGMYRRLKQAAETTRKPVDKVLLQTIRGNLPPSLEDVPADMREEVKPLLRANDDSLVAIARSSLEPREWRRHRRLLRKNASGALTDKERGELGHLRDLADRHVLRKSFALALLRWRGEAIPLSDDGNGNAPA